MNELHSVLNIIIHMRYSYSDRVAQVVEHDASNIKVVSSILTAVKVQLLINLHTCILCL